MSTAPCNKCGKTVYPTEKIEAAGGAFHKGCFKCNEDTCGTGLTLKTFKAHAGQIYCAKHVPAPKSTAIADSMSIMHAKSKCCSFRLIPS